MGVLFIWIIVKGQDCLRGEEPEETEVMNCTFGPFSFATPQLIVNCMNVCETQRETAQVWIRYFEPVRVFLFNICAFFFVCGWAETKLEVLALWFSMCISYSIKEHFKSGRFLRHVPWNIQLRLFQSCIIHNFHVELCNEAQMGRRSSHMVRQRTFSSWWWWRCTHIIDRWLLSRKHFLFLCCHSF